MSLHDAAPVPPVPTPGEPQARPWLSRQNVLLAAAAVASVVVFLSVLQLSRGIDPRAHAEAVAALGNLDTTTHSLERQVLESSQGLVAHYDGLVQTTRSLRSAYEEVAGAVEAVDIDAVGWNQRLGGVEALIRQKSELVERFKRESAVLKNSLRYLPLAGAHLEESALTVWPEVRTHVESVVGTTLIYHLLPESDLLEKQRAAVAAFERAIATAPKGVRQEARLLAIHAKRVAEHQGILQPILAKILDGALTGQVGGLRAAYLGRVESLNAAAQTWRWVLYGFSLLLLVGFLAVVRRLVLLFRTLERRVAQRTAALTESNRNMASVLGNVGEGLVLLDEGGRVKGVPSAALAQWLEVRPGDRWSDVLTSVNPEDAELFEMAWEMAFEGFMPLEVSLQQFPGSLDVREFELGVTYRPITSAGDGALDGMLVVLTDESAINARARAEEREKQQLVLFMHLLEDVAAFREFRDEADSLITQLTMGLPRLEEMRCLHTLKGNFAVFGLEGLSNWVHGLETLLADERRAAEPAEIAALEQKWNGLIRDIAPVLGTSSDATAIRATDLQMLKTAIADQRPHADLLRILEAWEFDPAGRRLDRLASQAERIAIKLNRSVSIEVDDGDVRLRPGAFVSVWQATVHVLRNALDHGIEPEIERRDQGKSETARLLLATYRRGDALEFMVADDGRGVDWATLAARVRSDGGDPEAPDALHEALFADGVSTRDEVNGLSGRGVGLSALRQVVASEGGTVAVYSEPGMGTRVVMSFPGAAQDGRIMGPERATYDPRSPLFSRERRTSMRRARMVSARRTDEVAASHPLLRAANLEGLQTTQ